jgi:TonB-dependent starch-binding outer membrane protein SusC
MGINNNCVKRCKKKAGLFTTMPKTTFLTLAFFTLFISKTFAQSGTVSGTVKDPDNKAVAGATIIVKQTKTSAVADADGKFVVTAMKGNTLVISSINFETQNIVVGSDATIDIKLERQAGNLADVVVIGYGSAKKKDVTGAVTSVNLAKVSEIPLTSVDQVLTGRAGGVQVNQTNGQAGAGTSIRIRGGNSLNGTNEPLFVVDGFPIINDNAAFAAGGPLGLTNSGAGNPGQGNPNGALNWLNPADIASIEVLKDASATAIYGSRGANGVIIVTTKKGRAGQQPRINFNASYGVSQLNDSKIELMSGKEYAAYSNLWNKEQNLPVFYKDTTIDGILYPTPDKVTTNTNWVDAIKRNGKTQNYSIDFSGGKDVIYSGSIGWLNQETPLIGSQFKRANFRLNLVTNLTPWLSLDNTTTYSQSTTDNSPADVRDVQKFGLFEAALTANPAEPVYKPDGSLNARQNFSLQSPAIGFSPISLANDILNRNTISTFLNNISLKAKIIQGLSFELRGSLFKNDLLRDIYYNSKTTFNGFQVGGLASKNSNNSNSYLVEAFGNYNKSFGKNQFTAVAGYSYQKSAYRTINSGASNFSSDELKNENLASGSTQYPTQTNRLEDYLTSYFVRLNNVYHDKYIITFTARYDGSSKFAKGNQWSFFPSGAISWRISQEEFLKNVNSLSDLKLRVSYGLSGNQAVASLQTKSLLGFNQYPYGGVLQTGVFPAVLGNPDLTWETTKQLNIGLDFGFWNQRLSGSINYYAKTTDDLLQYLPLPANSGYTTQLSNVGSISNNGIELELRAAVVNGKDFKWDVNANIASNKNKMKDLGRGELDTLQIGFEPVAGQGATIALIKNQPVGLFWGYVADGIFRDGGELAKGPVITGVSKVGTRRFKDLNGDGVITDRDRRVIGDPNPKFVFGISNNFSYKGFDLNMLVQGSIGGDMWNFTDFLQTRLGNRSKAANDYFTASNLNAKYPTPGSDAINFYPSDFTVESASFVRLKSLNVGYSFPVGTIKFVRTIRLYFSATNLLTITKYKGYDPEVNSFAQSNLFRNIDVMSIPLFKTYTFGLNVGF